MLGSGALGLLAIAAIRRFTNAGRVVAVAKHPVQRELARPLGADVIVGPDEVARAVRRVTGTLALGDGDIVRLTGGAEHVIDCVGSEQSIAEGLRVVKPGGRITMVGMPGHVHVDLTGLWQREVELVGRLRLRHRDAWPTVASAAPSTWRSNWSRRPISAGWSRPAIPSPATTDAITHAANAGARGAVRVAFDLTAEKERTRL